MITHLATPDDLDRGTVEMTGDAYRHLLRARRLAVGHRVRVVDGAGRARWGTLATADRRRATVELGAPAPTNEPGREVRLLVATPRPERASWLVEKATEMGVAAVRFLAGERAPRQPGDGTVERWRRVAAAALEQCHGSRLPTIDGPHPLDEVPALVAGTDAVVLLDPDGGAWPAVAPDAAVAVLVGPEGGWSDSERTGLLAAGAVAVGLGPRVLRVETAAVVAAGRLLATGRDDGEA